MTQEVQRYRRKRRRMKRRGLSASGRIKLALAMLLVGGAIYAPGSFCTAPGIVWTSKDRAKRLQMNGGGFYLCIGFGNPRSLEWALDGRGIDLVQISWGFSLGSACAIL